MSNQDDFQAVYLDVNNDNKEIAPANDPFAVDETTTQTNQTGEEQEETEPPTDTEEALNKLKASSARLGSALSTTTSDLDKKLGISSVFSTIGTKVKEVDEQGQVSGQVTAAVKNVSSTLGSLFSAVDAKLQISSKSKEIGTSLGEQFSDALHSDPVKKTTIAVHDFDEAHGITRQTASTLAAGADLLASAFGGTEEPQAPRGTTVDITPHDEDGLPTSFQKPFQE